MSVKLGDTEVAGFGGGGGSSVDIDDLTITKNSNDEIQASAVVDQNTGIVKTWTGTAAEYDAIVTKAPDTEYIITDDIGGPATEIGQITEALNNKVDKGHEVIEFQAPTAENVYTWYRLYADGWVEQGGIVIKTGGAQVALPVTLPITMGNASYYANAIFASGPGDSTIDIGLGLTASVLNLYPTWATTGQYILWEVKGMAA